MKKLNIEKDCVLFIGDLHGKYDNLFNLLREKKISDSLIIALGDFGVGFKGYSSNTLKKLNKRLGKTKSILCVVRGNHDNPKWFNIGRCDTDKVLDVENILFVEDYSVITVKSNDISKNILCVGGATSIDRMLRVQDIDWWKDEVFRLSHIDISDIKVEFDKIDVICTHSSPYFCLPTSFNNMTNNRILEDSSLERDLKNERIKISRLYDEFKDFGLTNWYYGHFHDSQIEHLNNIRFRMLDIDEIEELRF